VVAKHPPRERATSSNGGKASANEPSDHGGKASANKPSDHGGKASVAGSSHSTLGSKASAKKEASNNDGKASVKD
jgi:hypothetical protein